MLKKRLSVCFYIIFFFSFILIIKVSMISSSQKYLNAAKNQQLYKIEIFNNRAKIFDSNMQQINKPKPIWKAIALPDISVVDELEKISTNMNKAKILEMINKKKPFVAEVNTKYTDNDKIVIFDSNTKYCDDPLAIHTIGYCNTDGKGMCGIEKVFDEFLAENGTKQEVFCEVNGKNQFLKGRSINAKMEGNGEVGIVLTIDSTIQRLVEKICESKIKKGAVVVLDAKNSNIIAMASFPKFSIQNLRENINDNETKPMVNRCLKSFPVGSAFKIVTSIAALKNGISENNQFICTGKIDITSQIYHCHKRDHGHGELDMKSAIKSSCNPYFIDLGIKIGSENLLKETKLFGFGREIQLWPKFATSSGTVPPKNMTTGELANFSFGQGYLTASPLHIAKMISVITQNGKCTDPRLILGTTQDGKTIKYENDRPTSIITTPDIANKLKEFMIEAINDTPANPKLTTAGGKSSTAQTGVKNKNNTEKLDTWFSGFFPAQDPKYIVVIILEDGQYGITDCGPIFAKIADHITNLKNT